MGVYNPRAKMPNWCGDCDSLLEGTEECEIYTIKDLQMHKRNDDCPLIEINDDVWENEKYKLIRMTEEQRVNKKLAEVVRCGECKYAVINRHDRPLCSLVDRTIKREDFCSYGERRADDNKRRSV